MVTFHAKLSALLDSKFLEGDSFISPTHLKLCMTRGLENGSSSVALWARPAVPITLETEAGGFQVQGLPALQSEFKTSLGNLLRSSSKQKAKGARECGPVVEHLSNVHNGHKGLGSSPATATRAAKRMVVHVCC